MHTILSGTEFSGSLQYFVLYQLVVIVVVVIVVVDVVVVVVVVDVVVDVWVVFEDASVVMVVDAVLQSQVWTSAKGCFSSTVKSWGYSVSKSVVNIIGGIGGNVGIWGGGLEPRNKNTLEI